MSDIDLAAEHFRTAIIATLGPASSSEAVIADLIDAGATIFRLNFSHGDEATHEQTLGTIRKVASRLGVHVGVLGDLPGPKIRLMEVPGDGIDLATGDKVMFRKGCGLATVADGNEPACFGCTWEGMIDCVAPGQRVLIDDGMTRLRCTGRQGEGLLCEVDVAGRVSSHKGVNLPDTDIDVDMPTERDRRFAAWAVEHDLDWVAMSFVRDGKDVQSLDAHLRHCAGSEERPIPIIAKFEVPHAVQHAAEILQEIDGLMVARGDLGVEMDIAMVPSIQKFLLSIGRDAGVPCIVATQMLQSMIESPMPTRAEASDVANAIFDGADGVMLSGETAVGRYPVKTVEMMRRINRTTEASMRSMRLSTGNDLGPMHLSSSSAAVALVRAVWEMARGVDARCVVVPSITGQHARLLSRNDFLLPVLAMATDEHVVRRMLLYRGVVPYTVDVIPEGEELVRHAQQEVLARNWASPGDSIIVVSGAPGHGNAGVQIVVHQVEAGTGAG